MEHPNSDSKFLIKEPIQPPTSDCFLPQSDSDQFGSFSQKISSQNYKRIFMFEFLGTYIMLMMGLGSVAQVTLNNDNGGSLNVHIAWGLGVVFGVYVSDGGHLNSAITIANVIFSGFPLKKALVYILAQFVGGFLSAASVYLIYLDSFKGYGMRQGNNGFYMKVPETAGIFCTFPLNFLDYNTQTYKTLSLGFSCISEFSATFLLYFLCLSFTDEKRKIPQSNLTGFFIGMVVLGIGCAYGQQTGYALNPARDFPPRLFAFCAGWGFELFTYGNYYFWVPVVMPIFGACAAGAFYEVFIRENYRVKINNQ